MNVNLTPNITGKNVNIIKGATQADLTNSVNNSKTYRDESEAFSIVSENKSIIATYSANSASYSATTASNAATIATTKANEANNSANSASASETVCIAKATIATDNADIAIAQAVIATNKATEANTSANTATTQAGISTTKASEASISASNALTSENNADTSEANALTYRNQAESFANSINPSNLVHISGTETITGNKTFSGTVSGLTKATVGLNNVDNTSDSSKSVNYATTAGTASASDVYSWAKEVSKPSYTASEIGLGNVTNESKTTMFTSPTFTGTVTLPSTTSIGTISSAELQYLDGVTSSIQTQITTNATNISNTQTQVDTHISVPTAYHIYNGSVEATNTVVTNGFSTTLYTGNGGTQSVNTGVDMSTQWGNDASEMFGGLVWQKSRSAAASHRLCDTVRGARNVIYSDLTNIQSVEASALEQFTSSGFIGGGAAIGANGVTCTSWNFQTTHRRTGVTNHGKAYTEHYNPFTGFTIIKYEGSGIAGHEIPHSLGRKISIAHFKNLTTTQDWLSFYGESSLYMALNLNIAQATSANWCVSSNDITSLSTGLQYNKLGSEHIMYGWANSYYDVDNTLIGNYEIGVYQGTGVSGNKVLTRGKPAWVMIKRLDVADNWLLLDNQRISGLTDGVIYPNLSNTEVTGTDFISFNTNDFTINIGSSGTGLNASGGQYLYMVVYDNDSGSGKSKYPRATDTTNLSINALVPYANGIDVNGEKVSISYKNETITGLTLTQGENYPYSKNDGTYGVNKYLPMYGKLRDRVIAGENPDYFDLETRKWYGTSGGNELVTNGTFDSNTNGWTAQNGATLSIVNGTLNIARGTGNYSVNQTISGLTIGKKLRVYFGTLNNITIFIANSTNTSNYASTSIGNSYIDIIPYETSINIQGHISSGTGNMDNISVFETVPTIGAEITPRTYLDCVVYADHNGQVSYVEELPKTTYFDEVKANEYQGKNACTAWVNFDGTTTPPTIRDSYNVASVVRTGTGYWAIYFIDEMDNANYSTTFTARYYGGTGGFYSDAGSKSTKFVTVSCINQAMTTGFNNDMCNIQIFGGRN